MWARCQGPEEDLSCVLSEGVHLPALPPLSALEEGEGQGHLGLAWFSHLQEGFFCNVCMKSMLFPGDRRGLTGAGGGILGSRQRFPSLVGVGRGQEGGCYPAHLTRALEPAVLGCVKSGNLPPLMYNLELTANKVGFCLYTLVLSVCLSV